MFLDAFLISWIPDENPRYGSTPRPLSDHLESCSEALSQTTWAFCPAGDTSLSSCPCLPPGQPVPLVIVPHSYPYTVTVEATVLVLGEAQCVQGSLHYSGYLRVQDQKLSNPPNEKEKCPQGEMSNCSEQQSFAGFPPSSTPRGYVHKGQPVLPPLHVSHWALLPGAADLKPRAR